MAAGAIAKALLRCVAGVEVLAFVSSVRDVTLDEGAVDLDAFTMDDVEANIVRCPHGPTAERMIAAIDEARRGRAPPQARPLACRSRRGLAAAVRRCALCRADCGPGADAGGLLWWCGDMRLPLRAPRARGASF